jgi:hypothetical protein
VRFYLRCAKCLEKVETVGGSAAAEACLCVVSAEQLSAGRSAGYAEREPALGSRSYLTRKCPENVSLFRTKTPPKKETRANTCFLWLPMLY